VCLGYWFPGTAPIRNWSHAEWREVVLHHWHASNMYDMEVSENRGTLNHPKLDDLSILYVSLETDGFGAPQF
jgi:hypothetical protein